MIPAIIVVSSILGLYLIVILVCVHEIVRANAKLKRKKQGINVLLAQKYDLVVSLGQYLENNNVFLPEEIRDSLKSSGYGNLKTMNTEERLSIKGLLGDAVNKIFDIAEKNGMKDSNRYITLKNSINDIDESYRKSILLYNNDIGAYNYWVNAILFRPFKLLFKIKGKEKM